MTRHYIRLDPAFDERKESYPDGPYAALVGTFCLAEQQPERGRFRSPDYLRRLLGKRGRHVAYLQSHGDVVDLPDGRVYVDGWDEWQEGDWKVAERVDRIRSRDKKSGAQRTADWRLRSKIFERDGFTCRYCGISDYPREWLVLEHVLPVTRGGATDEANLVTSCRACNHRKGNKTPDEAGMTLRPEGDRSRDTSQDTSPRQTETVEAVRSSALLSGEQSGAQTAGRSPAPLPPGFDDDPEGPALSWLIRHGCYITPGNGYHRQLVTAAERHGADALIAWFEKLARAGTQDGDTRGFVFGAIDALKGERPSLKRVKEVAEGDEDRARNARSLERTAQRVADLRAVTAPSDDVVKGAFDAMKQAIGGRHGR